MDNYYSKNRYVLSKLALVFFTCNFIACKYEEISYIPMNYLLNSFKYNLTVKDVVVMENEILKSVNYNLIYSNPHDFLKRLVYITNLDNINYFKCCILLEYLLYHPHFNCYN